MKIFFTADCHLNKPTYKGVADHEFTMLSFKNGDSMRSFRGIVDTVIQEQADLFAIVGDTYDNYEPLNPIRAFFNSQMKRLADANIPVIILLGNHDVCSRHHALEPVSAMGLKNIQVCSSPKLVSFKDKLLMLFPYAMEIENGTYSTKELFNIFFDHCQKKIEKTPAFQNKEIIFMGHFGVKGAILNTYDDLTDIGLKKMEKVEGKKKYFINSSSKDISIEDLDRLAELGVKYVALGDYHRHQILPTKRCISFYTGSIEKSDFSEADDDKGYVVYDSEAVEEGIFGKCKFNLCAFSRPMVELSGTLQEITENLDKIKNTTIGTLVKIKFKGNEAQLREYSDGQKELEKKIASKLLPVYVVASQEVVNKKENDEANEVVDEILNKENIDDKDILMVVEEAIIERISSKEEQQVLMKMVEDTFREIKEDN